MKRSLIASFLLLLAAGAAFPQNDECGGALPLVTGTNPVPPASGSSFNNSGATTTAGYPTLCAAIMNDVWFSFTPGATDTYVFDTSTPCGFTAGTMTNTTMALYDAAACGIPAAALACDADSGTGSLSKLQFPLTAGNVYFLRVGPTTNVFQTFYVNVRQGAIATNDECAGAIPVGLGTNPAPAGPCSLFTNELATNSAGWLPLTGCASPAINNDVWFTFTPPATGPYIIDTNTPCAFTAGTATNTTLAVYFSCTPGLPLACDGDTGGGSLSLVNLTLFGGTPYWIRVGTVTATTGTGTFYLNVNAGIVTAPNDTCATAIPVGLGTNPAPAAPCNTFSNAFATADATGLPAVCAAIVNDVWFSFTPPVSGDYVIDTETPLAFTTGTNTNSTAAVYGSCAVGAALACDADSGTTGTGLMSIVNVVGLTAGVPAFIRVGSTTVALSGTFYLNINRIFSLGFSSPFGPGSFQADIVAGPPSGSYFMCVTFYAGTFPAGWFFGIDPFLQEVADQVNVGPPFTGALTPTGDFTIGPFAPLPSGLAFYSVAIGFPGPLGALPMSSTAPKTFTIP